MEPMTSLRKATPLPPQSIDWSSRVQPILATIADAAADIDARSRLTAEALDALHQASLFRMLIPWELGGFQVDPATFVGVVEQVAYADASTAWILSQCSVCAMAVAYLPHATGMRIVGDDPTAVLAWGALPSGKAVREPGGWRISGRWFFASGSRHATWMGGRCPLYESDGTALLNADGSPAVRMFLFPKHEAQVVESWDVIGLRGTGSDSYSVEGLFVSDDCQFDVNVAADHPGLLYRIVNRHLYGPGVAGIALGLSRATLDAFLTMGRDEKKKDLRGSAAIHSELGWVEARWHAARAYLYAALERMWTDIRAGGTETVAHQIDIRRAATHAIHEAKAVVDFAYHEGGASTILASMPFERRVRDMQTVMQHGQSKRSNMEAVGRYALGLEPGPLIL